MDKEYFPFLNELSVKEPLMWVFDIDTGVILDMTPATTDFVKSIDATACPVRIAISITKSLAYRCLISW
jgi:hypothetical protein